ncbi:hypothetical protein KM043_008783 [Ampulex compressa]|nr:hypothetical protein KM043_008783 [Ampulex compressa]
MGAKFSNMVAHNSCRAMDYTPIHKRRRQTINADVNNLKEIYPCDLSMYDVPPTGEISLVEFQDLGLERLKVLQLVEINAQRTDLKTADDRKIELSNSLSKDGLKHFVRLLYASGNKTHAELDLQARRRDCISHFIMRLAYCQEPDRNAWLINQEVELFKLRFSSLDKDGVEYLHSTNNLDCSQITQDEKEEIREELYASTSKVTNIDTADFYKVPFHKVLDLVKSRRIYLKEGMAFIPQADLISLFVSYFKKNLVAGLESAKEYLSNISDDERLCSYIKSLPGSFSGMTRVVWSSTTTPIEKLDELSKSSYPLCMRTLHENLRTNHHLKNSGRIQYGLFIKGIGVTLEDALAFWKAEFTKKVDPNKFDKEYAYSIRHMFGKEGKQTNYTPLGCQKIITSSVGPGEHHGCPYRHMDTDSLRLRLLSCGLPPPSITEIITLTKAGHYILACTKYFETAHNRPPEKPYVHPNAYFMESRAILAKDFENTDTDGLQKVSKSTRGLNDKVNITPVRRNERTSVTPSQRMDVINNTPSRSRDPNGTPSRRLNETSARKTIMKPIMNMDENLNDEQIAQLIDDY